MPERAGRHAYVRYEPNLSMDLSDLGRRIFGQHYRIIALLAILGAALGLLLQAGTAKTYTASTRFVLDTPDPKSRTEAMSIADTAKAIATSPALVKKALEDAHVTGRNSVEVAAKDVDVRGLGASSIVELSVKDHDREVAKAIANALAQGVLRIRSDFSSGHLQKVLPLLDERINDLTASIAVLNRKIDSLNAGGSAVAATALGTKRDSLAQERGELESTKVSLLSADAARPNALVISPATAPSHLDPSRWVSNAVLGALLGLILGIGVAAAIESFRPTLVGSENMAQALDTALLGELPSVYPEKDAERDLSVLKGRLQLAGDAAGARGVGLVAADRSVDLWQLAAHLGASPADGRSAVPSGAEAVRAARDGARDGVRIRPVKLEGSQLQGRDGAAIVLVSPTAMKRSELLALSHLLRLRSLPLLGLITYRNPRSRPWPWQQAQRDRVAVVTPE